MISDQWQQLWEYAFRPLMWRTVRCSKLECYVARAGARAQDKIELPLCAYKNNGDDAEA